ncbi:MAG: universal stress protein [Vicinamibacterales bacterium]
MTPWRVLLPFDASDNALRAVDHAVALERRGLALDLHLVNVQPPLRSDVTGFVPAANVQDFHREEGLKVLARAAARLDASGVAHTDHVVVGPPTDAIAELASSLEPQFILMGTHGRTAVASLLLGSVAAGVVRASTVPVMLVR